jgi:hypothetical protein
MPKCENLRTMKLLLQDIIENAEMIFQFVGDTAFDACSKKASTQIKNRREKIGKLYLKKEIRNIAIGLMQEFSFLQLSFLFVLLLLVFVHVLPCKPEYNC